MPTVTLASACRNSFLFVFLVLVQQPSVHASMKSLWQGTRLQDIFAGRSTHIVTENAFTPPAFCHGYECPRYTVSEQKQEYEARYYEESIWVAVNMGPTAHFSEVVKAFAVLTSYFSGSNDQHKSLKGTVPYGTTMTAETGNEVTSPNVPGKNVTIMMYLPWEYQDGQAPIPQPVKDNVRVIRLPAWKAYVSGFGGFPSDSKYASQYDQLLGALQAEGARVDLSWTMMCTYDSMVRLWGRHNEVMIPDAATAVGAKVALQTAEAT